MKFTNPISGGKINKSYFSKKVDIESLPNSIINAPYDGLIVSYDDSKCGGKLKIKHNVNGEEYYSVFCGLINLPNHLRRSNTRVTQNEPIGETSTNKLTFSIENPKGNEEDVIEFMKGKETKIKDTEKKDYEKKSYSRGDIKTDPITSSLIKGMLSPFGVVSSMFDSEEKEKRRKERQKEKEEKEKKESGLNEEIKRIKELLK